MESIEQVQDLPNTQPETVPTISLDTLAPEVGEDTYELTDGSASNSQPIQEYINTFDVGATHVDNPLELSELTLGQAISESSSFEELFQVFGELGQATSTRAYSPSFDYARESNKNMHVSAFSEVTPEQEINTESVSTLQDDLMVEENKSDLQVHLEESAFNLSQLEASEESKAALAKFTVEFSPLYYNRAISELLQAQQAKAVASTSFVEKIDELGYTALIDVFGVQERAQQVNILESITGKEQSISYYRSDQFAEAIENNWEGLSFKEQFELLHKQLQASNAVGEALGFRSSITASATWDDLNKAMTQGDLGHDDWVSWVESASAIPAVGWLVGLPSRVKSFTKAVSISNNNYRNVFLGVMDAEMIAKDADVVAEFQRMFNPSDRSGNVEILIKENRVNTVVETPFVEVEQAASNAISRGERKKLESLKKNLSFKRSKITEGDLNKEARELARTSNIKFKTAKTRLKKELEDTKADLDAQLKGVQAQIDSAYEAFKAKRTLAQADNKGIPRTVEKTEQRTIMRVDNGKLGDVTAKWSPNTLKAVFHTEQDITSLEGTVRALGYTPDTIITGSINKVPDDVTEGINPTLLVKDTEVNPSDLIPNQPALVSPELIAQRNIKDLLSIEEQKVTADKTFEGLKSIVNGFGQLRVDHSLTTPVDANTVRSIGRIGKTESEGYKSYEEAKFASANVPENNVSIVVKHPAKSSFSTVAKNLEGEEGLEYFIQVEKDITFTPDDALDFSDTNTFGGTGWVTEMFLEPVDKLDRNIVKAVSYLRNIDNSLVKKLDKVLEPFSKAKSHTREEASKLLTYGDAHETEITPELASSLLGRVVNEEDSTYVAYGAVNRYYKEVASIRNWRERSRLDREGFKRTGLVDDQGKEIFGKVLRDDEVIGAIRNEENKVWDATLGKEVDLTEDMVNTSLHGRAVIRTGSTISRDGKLYDTSIVELTDLKALPQQVLPLRKGHVDLFYEDVGAIIKVSKGATVNGKVREDGMQSVLRLANSEEEASKWLGAKAEGSKLTNLEILQQGLGKDGGEISVELSREAKMDLGVVDSKWNGNVKPYNLRKRGESPVESINGSTQVMNLEDRLVKTHNALSARFARDGLDVIKNRWLNTWGEYLNDPYALPENLKTGLAKQFPTDKIRQDAQNILNYIHNQERMLGWRKDSEFVNSVDSAISKVTGGVVKNPAQGVVSVARWVSIYGRPMYQALVNTGGVALQVAQLDPIKGTASVLQTFGTVHGLLVASKGGKVESNAMAKMYGFDDANDYNKFLEGVSNSGIFSTAQLDNILAGATGARLTMRDHIAVSALKKTVALPKAMVTWSTDMGHLIAYRHAVKRVKEKGLDPYSGKGRIETDKTWQDLTQRMNKSSQLVTETNEYAKVVALFTQHVMKGWKDTVLQPAAKLVTDPVSMAVKKATGKDVNLAISKNPSLWAETYQQAFISTSMNIALYGLAGLVGKNTLDAVGITGEVDEAIVEGSLDLAIASLTGQDMDASARLSYGDAIGMFFSLTDLDSMSLNLLGAGDMAISKVGKFANSLKVSLFNTPFVEDDDLVDFTQFMAMEGLSIFSGYSDMRKARMVNSWGIYFNNSGAPKMRVDPDSWLATVFSFTPDRIQEDSSIVYDNELEEKVEDYYLKTVPDLFTRYAYHRMIELEKKGELTFESYIAIQEQALRLTQGSLATLGAHNLALRAKRRVLKNVLYPRDVNLDAKMKLRVRDMVERVTDMSRYDDAKKKLEMLINSSDDPNVVRESERALTLMNHQMEILNNGN